MVTLYLTFQQSYWAWCDDPFLEEYAHIWCLHWFCWLPVSPLKHCLLNPGLHRNANTRHSKTMRMFDVPVLQRRGKQHLAVRLDKHSTNSLMLLVDCWYIKGNSHAIRLCKVDSLPRRMPNSVQMYQTFYLGSRPHALFIFSLRADVNSA